MRDDGLEFHESRFNYPKCKVYKQQIAWMVWPQHQHQLNCAAMKCVYLNAQTKAACLPVRPTTSRVLCSSHDSLHDIWGKLKTNMRLGPTKPMFEVKYPNLCMVPDVHTMITKIPLQNRIQKSPSIWLASQKRVNQCCVKNELQRPQAIVIIISIGHLM